jgi:hypothetical protein
MRVLIVEFDHVYPALKELAAADLVASEAEASQTAKAGTVTLWDPLDEPFKVPFPRNNDGGQPVTDRGYNRVRSAGWKQVTDVPDIMTTFREELRYRIGHVLVDEREHLHENLSAGLIRPQIGGHARTRWLQRCRLG